MKRSIIKALGTTLLAAGMMLSLHAQDPSTWKGENGIGYARLNHNFGVIPQNKPAVTVFKFTNTSQEPLYIRGVRKECGCMEVDWPVYAIRPGQVGKITVTYNAKEMGEFDKGILITHGLSTKAGTNTKLKIKGTVATPPQSAPKGKTAG